MDWGIYYYIIEYLIQGLWLEYYFKCLLRVDLEPRGETLKQFSEKDVVLLIFVFLPRPPNYLANIRYVINKFSFELDNL